MPDRPPLTILVAASLQRAMAWCKDHERSPRDPDLLYLVRPDDTRRACAMVLRRGVDKVIDLGGPLEVLSFLETRYRAQR